MTELGFFLGRFHVLALHLPIGIIVAVVALEFLARGRRFRYLNSAGVFLWAAAALTSLLTVALGYLHFAEGGFDGPSAYAHRLYGTAVAVVTTLIWLLRVKLGGAYRKIQPLAGVLVIVLVSITGHYGGNLTHGADYLVEYAPAPLRSLAGLEAPRPPVTELAQADPYLDIVRPMLQRRCAGCHGADKRGGEFDVSSHASTLAGGETGSAVVPGRANVSELYRRITLPPDDDAFMPAEGRTPLTPAQVAIVRWWIDAGAPQLTTVGQLGISPDVAPLLAAAVGLGESTQAGGAPATLDRQLLTRLSSVGFNVRPLSLSDARLSIAVRSPGTPLDAAALAELESAAEHTVELNLQDSALDDAAVQRLAGFPDLRALRLSNNAIGDDGIAALRGLTQLETLNIYGNHKITDNSLSVLENMPALRDVYVWETAITPGGMAALRSARQGLKVHGGSELRLAP